MLSSFSHQTPSQGLNIAFRGFQLDSQPDSCSLTQQPAFSASQQSQEAPFSSQDFITPVEQQTQTENTDAYGRQLRTPAALSPSRAKRSRKAPGEQHAAYAEDLMRDDSEVGCATQASQQELRAPAPTRQKLRHLLSPQSYCSVFQNASEQIEDKTISFRPQPVAEIYMKLFREVSILGQGNYSKVTRVEHRLDGTEYAVKRSSRAVTSDADRRPWIQEIQAMAAAGVHSHIVRYHTAWLEPHGGEDCVFIQMEMCGMSLGSKLALHAQPFREPELVDVLMQMASALQHLHGKGIAHLDVTPDNIFMTVAGDYKLGDFGLARPMHSSNPGIYVGEGDCRYLPRELLNDDHSQLDKADTFALGASLYELATASLLPSDGEKYHHIRDGKLVLLPTFTKPFQDMLRAMMHPDPSKRPSNAAILASALITKRKRQEGFAPLNLQRSCNA